MERRARRERGSVLPFVALLILATGGLVIGLGRLGADAVARTRASTAADAAALAGAAEGPEAAEALARSNGGRLVAYEADGREVQVTVELGRAQATARARRVTPDRTASQAADSRWASRGNHGACVDSSTSRGGCPAEGIPYTPTRGDGAAPDEHDRGGSLDPPGAAASGTPRAGAPAEPG